jgi:hypothetical protein
MRGLGFLLLASLVTTLLGCTETPPIRCSRNGIDPPRLTSAHVVKACDKDDKDSPSGPPCRHPDVGR